MTYTKAGQSGNKPDVETLHHDPAYRQILELDFNDMIPFVISNIRKRGIIPFFYMGLNTIFLFFMIFYTVWAVRSDLLTGGKVFWQLVAGVLTGSILVIPPHELLHGLAYRLMGARQIRFGVDLQQFIFYVTANHFPISKRQLTILALTPFVIINLLVIVLTAAWASQYTLFSASLLFCHNIMCIGDFAIINYASSQMGEVYTYDDTENMRAYFFVRESK